MKRLNDWIIKELGDIAVQLTEKQEKLCQICSKDGRIDVTTRTAVYEATDEILEALFPGCYGHELVETYDIPLLVSDRLRHAAAILGKLTDYAFKHACDIGMCEACNCEERATETVIDLMQRIPDIHAMLLEDIQAAYEGDPAAISLNEIILSYPFVEAIATHRIANVFYEHRIPLIPRIMSERVHGKTGIDIHPGAQIGRHFFIDHGTGVVIGETCEIGDHVKLYQGVTLGALSFHKDEYGKPIKGLKRHPTIEDDVTIYSGATILGGDTVVGKGSVIGGNVWLTQSVPAYSKVYNDPPKHNIIPRRERVVT